MVSTLRNTIYDSVLTGNGLLGTATYRSSDADAARIDVGRTDLYDHQPGGDRLYRAARLPLGHFEVDLGAPIVKASGTMQLYDGYAVATYHTSRGTAKITTTTPHDDDTVIVEIGRVHGLATPKVVWKPAPSISPRVAFATTQAPPANYQSNPPPLILQEGRQRIAVQRMRAGGAYGLGYITFTRADKTILIARTFYSATDADAKKAIARALSAFDIATLHHAIRRHQQSWHRFYAKSSYRIPDRKLQAFYDMQLYKLACATRPGGPAIDLQGPWTAPTPWPGYWMNLNLQLTYSPIYAANHLELASTLVDLIDRNKKHLIANVPAPYRNDSAAIGRSASPDLVSPVALQEGTPTASGEAQPSLFELGNLTWLLYYYDRSYRYSMDRALGERLFDLLGRSVQYAMHLTAKDSRGRYAFVVKSYSPEYPDGYGENTNYSIATLKWGLATLISLDTALGRHDRRVRMWQDYLDHFIDYPQDATGLRIASDIPFAVSHRHYSHLLMIYPFHLLNWDHPDQRALIARSLQTWRSKTQAFEGYSWTGLASIYATMGRGDDALASLRRLLDTRIEANTLYRESGPVVETPLSAMASLQELSLQDWNGVVRVFPAVPSTWRDVSFDHLRTEGAFLVSARRRDGNNELVTIASEKGGELRIKPNLGDHVACDGCRLDVSGHGIYRLRLRPGETVTLRPSR